VFINELEGKGMQIGNAETIVLLLMSMEEDPNSVELEVADIFQRILFNPMPKHLICKNLQNSKK